jgi:formylglycine-generating enzyme required for sulfatase activity
MPVCTSPIPPVRSRSGLLRRAIGAIAAGTMFAAMPASIAHAQTACDADVDADGTVGAADLSLLLSVWGSCTGCNADVDNDGSVGAADLSLLLALWGGTCSQVPWATVLEAQPDPAVVTNVALRNAIIATGLPWRVRDDASQIEMVLVPPGTFSMGCSASSLWGCDTAEFPVHGVTLTNAFYIGRYEVTQAQWTAKMGSNPSLFVNGSKQVPPADVPNRPVEQVSWNMAQGFLSATALRLPTEAEWEFAYRAGTTTAFHSIPGEPSGTNDDVQAAAIAWYYMGSCANGAACQTRPVGGKAANSLGIHDMAGNVAEWVNDWYRSEYYAESPSINPPGPSSGSFGYRVLRGGGIDYFSGPLRASARLGNSPDNAYWAYGFRVARNP